MVEALAIRTLDLTDGANHQSVTSEGVLGRFQLMGEPRSIMSQRK